MQGDKENDESAAAAVEKNTGDQIIHASEHLCTTPAQEESAALKNRFDGGASSMFHLARTQEVSSHNDAGFPLS